MRINAHREEHDMDTGITKKIYLKQRWTLLCNIALGNGNNTAFNSITVINKLSELLHVYKSTEIFFAK